MQLPPLQPLNNFQSFVSGDVTIDPSAAIAPGVLLTTDADSRIIIGAGVSIGMGSILDAREGNLEIESGAVLGAGVLVIGTGKIGANACIGSATTIFNGSIAPKQVVPPGSLVGDQSRRIAEKSAPETPKHSAAANPKKIAMPTIKIVPLTEKVQEPSVAINDEPAFTLSASTLEEQKTTPVESPGTLGGSAAPPAGSDLEQGTPVQFAAYGQVHLNRLLVTLFPHNQSLNRPNQDGKAD